MFYSHTNFQDETKSHLKHMIKIYFAQIVFTTFMQAACQFRIFHMRRSFVLKLYMTIEYNIHYLYNFLGNFLKNLDMIHEGCTARERMHNIYSIGE